MISFESQLIVYIVLALAVALIVSFLMTPVVKTFAYKVGAIDVPKDDRRMHKVPVPRLGGLAIFIGFMVSIFIFVPITPEMRSILLGAVVIVVLGVVDDIPTFSPVTPTGCWTASPSRLQCSGL